MRQVRPPAASARASPMRSTSASSSDERRHRRGLLRRRRDKAPAGDAALRRRGAGDPRRRGDRGALALSRHQAAAGRGAADELAPLVPVGLERRIGEAVDNQVRTLFGGKACAGAPGSAALAKLSAALASRAALPLPAEVSVLDSGIPNAVALPGGRVYLFEGLLRRAREPDEIAGILAHELGHVARRDGMRKLIQTGGSSFLLGLLFGDITGGGTLIFLGRALIDSSYSRDAETAADRFAADVMVG